MNKSILSVISLFLLLSSCQNTLDTQTAARIIHIADFSGKTLDRQRHFPLTRSLALKEGAQGYIGQIKDICAIDSNLYLLDAARLSLASFSLQDGKLQNRVRSLGNGPLEYILPMALTSDAHHVYLLDMSGMSIIVYDKFLRAQRKIALTFPCVDFIKMDDGFLCYNLAPAEASGPLVFIDREGKVLESFQVNHRQLSVMTGGKIFTRNVREDVFMLPPFSHTVYRWNRQKKQPEEYIRLDFGNKNLPEEMHGENLNPLEEPYALPTHCFVGKERVLCSFLYGKQRYYTLSAPGGEVRTGVAVSPSQVPFFPQWQVGDILAGTCSTQGNTGQDGEVLLLFDLNGQ